VALAALAAGPALGVLLGAKVVGGYHFRYTVPAAVGLAGLFAFAVGRAAGQTKWGCLAAAAAFAATGAAGQWKDAPKHFRAEAAALAATADFLDARAAGGAVVVESPFEFTRLWHYHAGRQFDPVFLADPAAALRHTRVDTIDRGLEALARATPAPVVGFGDVLRRLGEGKPTYFFGPRIGWLAGELADRGVRFEPVESRQNGTLFRLTK
jgi:hypothetical protein